MKENNPAYTLFVGDVFVHGGRSIIGNKEFFSLIQELGSSASYLYVKIKTAYIPVFPESSVPSNSVAFSKEDAQEYEIEKERSKSMLVANPETMEWMERY